MNSKSGKFAVLVDADASIAPTQARRFIAELADALNAAGMDADVGFEADLAGKTIDPTVRVLLDQHSCAIRVRDEIERNTGVVRLLQQFARQWFSAEPETLHANERLTHKLSRRMLRIEKYADSLEERLAEAKADARELWHRKAFLQARVDAMEASLSWRLTRLLRAVGYMARGVRKGLTGLVSGSRAKGHRFARATIFSIARLVLRNPSMKRVLRAALRRVPWLHSRLAGLTQNAGIRASKAGHVGFETAATELELSLPEDARKVYRDLQRAIHRRGAAS